jgi:hypothetical protein
MKKWITIPVISIIISIINICVSSPLIIEYFVSPNVELAVHDSDNKETIFQMYTLTNTGKKTATNVEVVFIMHNKYEIIGVEALKILGLKKQILSLGDPFVLYKLSIDKIVPRERYTFIIQGNIADIKALSKTTKENSIAKPFLEGCRHDQGLCKILTR